MTRRKHKDEDEQELLRRAFKDVTPLKDRAIGTDAPAKPVRKASAKRIALDVAPKPKPKSSVTSLPELTAGAAVGVDLRTVQKLKRGKIEIAARLDLHGHTQDQAFGALERFLAASQSRGARSVLVITGKSGVLRQQVPRWLNAPPNRARVLSFTSARPNDGGDGALYILLRKAKAS